MPAHWKAELNFIPLMGGALSLVRLEVVKCLGWGGSLGFQSASLPVGGAAFPPSLLFGLRLLRAYGWGQIFPKWPPLEEHTLMITPKTFASSVHHPQ